MLSLITLSVLYYNIKIIECFTRINITYYPSEWENSWKHSAYQLVHSNEDTKEWKKGCELMKKDLNKINIWLDYWKVREECTIKDSLNNLNSTVQSNITNDDYLRKQKSCHLDEWNSEVLSYYVITDFSTGIELSKIPIEPLVSFLRHPKHFCNDIQGLGRYGLHVNKDYMYPLMLSEIYPIEERIPRYAQKFFFDLGASLYNKGFGGASQEWFIETYRARGIDFDRILAWEVKVHDPAIIFGAMPLKIFSK